MSETNMWLLIDDCRDYGKLIARDGETGLRILKLLSGCLDGVMLDHDLGQGVNGYQVLLSALEAGILPAKVQLVTGDPAGRKYMEQTLTTNGYVKKGQTWECVE